jgi:hypothetical protein
MLFTSRVSPSTTCVIGPEISIPSDNVGAGNVGLGLFDGVISSEEVESLLLLELLLSLFSEEEELSDSDTFSQRPPGLLW